MSDNQYIVRIMNLPERTKEEFSYNRVADAIQAAASFTTPEKFNEGFFEFMTQGFLYIGDKSEDYPAGNQILFISEPVNTRGVERPLVPPIRFIPKQAQKEAKKEISRIAGQVSFSEVIQHEKP